MRPLTLGALGVLVATAVMALGTAAPKATAFETTTRDSRSWSQGGITITFNVPETYSDCTASDLHDTLYTTGVPGTYRLLGGIDIGYINTVGAFVVTQTVTVDKFGNLTQVITYPPHAAITVNQNGFFEYHVSPHIEVYDAGGFKVLWVGGDQTNAPGTLGPGGQDWDVYCQGAPPPPPPTAAGGCTPGYWKQTQHFPSYTGTGVTPATTFQSVFGPVPGVATLSWVQALGLNGGGVNALIRHAAAAYLNSQKLDFALTPTQVVALFQQAIGPGGNIEGTKNVFAGYNEAGCPLN